MSLDTFHAILDRLIEAEGQIDVLNLSGGEPLLHPRVLDIVDAANGREEIVRVSISTNGLALLESPDLVEQLVRRNVVLSLQMDGFDDGAYRTLRAKPLAEAKEQILELLDQADVSTSLIMTLAAGVNESQLPRVVQTLVDKLGCEFLSLSAHKINGPKGVGALYWRGQSDWSPLIYGGDQEQSRRA